MRIRLSRKLLARPVDNRIVVAVLLIVTGVLGGLTLASAQDGNGEDAKPVIVVDKSLGISLSVVVVLLAGAAGYAASHQRAKQHYVDKSIHHTVQELADEFVPRESFDLAINAFKESIELQFKLLKEEMSKNGN